MKEEISSSIKKQRINRKIAEKIGVTEGYISQIVNHKKINISKTMAYAVTKAIASNLEIENIFDIM
jgi:plasmid maintenance system antidote protein VapI